MISKKRKVSILSFAKIFGQCFGLKVEAHDNGIEFHSEFTVCGQIYVERNLKWEEVTPWMNGFKSAYDLIEAESAISYERDWFVYGLSDKNSFGNIGNILYSRCMTKIEAEEFAKNLGGCDSWVYCGAGKRQIKIGSLSNPEDSDVAYEFGLMQ